MTNWPTIPGQLTASYSPLFDRIDFREIKVATQELLAMRDESVKEFNRNRESAVLRPLRATGIEVFQINVGKLCNQTCAHCHVDAGPTRTEVMSQATAEQCMEVLARTSIAKVDITGGAPELCPAFEYLVRESRRLGRQVIDR